MALHRSEAPPRHRARGPRPRGRRLLLAALVLLAAAALPSLTTSAPFVATTGTTVSLAATSLTGANAPLAGVSSFTATPASATTCSLTWTALSGGTAVADRLDVASQPEATAVSSPGSTAAGSVTVTVPRAAAVLALRSRAGLNWISADAVNRTAVCPAPGLAGVDAGSGFTCAVRTDGTLWCWGAGSQGQLGLGGSGVTTSTPTQVGAATTWRQVDLGARHGCAVRTDTTLWCWGTNENGQVGNNGYSDVTAPVSLGSGWAQVSSGLTSTCAVKTGGTLWCWGGSYYGQLGTGTSGGNAASKTPQQVGSATTWRSVSVGATHACAVQTGGTLWCWGANTSGSLGDGTTTQRTAPVQVGGATTWAAVSAGWNHTCALRTDSSVWCWGANGDQQVDASVGSSTATPTQVTPGGSGWAAVTAGLSVTCATRTDRTLWCWGSNADGRSGQGTTSGSTAVTQVGTGTTWTTVAAGLDGHVCAARTDGTVACWGRNTTAATGQIQTGWSSPQQVDANTWTAATLGFRHGCGLRTGGTLWCWGSNEWGQAALPAATLGGSGTPTQVSSPNTYLAVSAGAEHTCAVRNTGTMWCWGRNRSGVLGTATTTMSSSTPLQVGSSSSWTSVTAGAHHACGLNGGAVYCWGEGTSAQLGDGTASDRTGPVQVGGSTDWTQVSAGDYHTCGLRGTGSLYCWGANWSGQGGTTTGLYYSNYSPEPVGAATDWSAVAAYGFSTCGLRGATPSTLYCWGSNTDGQVGDGTTTDRSTPVQIGPAGVWKKLLGGHGDTACATRSDDTLWCWGRNAEGEYGTGTTTASTTPVQVATSVTALTTGFDSTCRITATALLQCAGGDAELQTAWMAPVTSPAQVGGATTWAN